MTSAAAGALRDAAPRTFWLDDPERPAPLPALVGAASADLVVVGGGYTGLWTALLARERDPSASVLVLEAGECGGQASGRNGGFASASLTHGFGNGLERWPEELALLDRLGADNLAEIGATVARLGIDCDWQETGELTVATRPHHVAELQELGTVLAEHGSGATWLDAAEAQAQVASPTYLGALSEPDGTALLEPARLAWGLRRACLEAGVVVHEQTRAVGLERAGAGVELTTLGPGGPGRVRAGRVALATNAFPPLLRRLRLMTVPVYDHVLMTEPLSAEQKAAIGWEGRQGVGDASNLFHYYRLTRDDRILWGGYDAVYHWGSRIDASLEQRERTHRMLAQHFLKTFPQLAGIRFTHRWGGVIDTCTRFSAFFGTALAGRVGYALGYTGLGVAASRFGAQVVLDLLDGADTERTRLRMVREQPLPFPPEPLRSVGINLTRWSLERADRSAGHRNLWLRGLDAAGLGFDS
ncbi:Gamma-glutamylputrescine oxidoreductase [Nocardioides dokdonensis FR1436]|uniref:Gamma-glutamylputrescine oxidoreductase n=1 Tax=Nocardioides dokdonensis FR1436 TaxID=1300347 RepID=A0A1A9GL25_9ACTN|nr:FAD-dependent oxidoreductase [Nocardioides dokdonensis]ANH38999.1 Gamma-glutamylputrescine oxidoreductase [Nocardioides dokdonensis FR1436]